MTDLFVVKEYRHRGLGTTLLRNIEQDISALGVNNIWTWTAGYEAPRFYKKMGYKVFTEMEKWYSDGSSRIGFRKELT